MSCLMTSIAHSDPALQALIEQMKETTSLASLILVALRLGHAVAVKVVEEILNERGQAPDEGGTCPECGQQLESKGLKPRTVRTLIGWVKWQRRGGGGAKGGESGRVGGAGGHRSADAE